jgi:hypothetical protein
MVTRTALRIALTAIVLARIASLASGQELQTQLSKQEMKQFLLSAKIVDHKDIPKGVTRPVRLRLSDGKLTHDAAFSMIDERIPIMRYKDGRMEFDFVDSYKYNLAAYGLAELLGLDELMPVSVERKWQGQKGSLSWWLPVKWDEGDRVKQNLSPPDSEAWNQQQYRMHVFTQLIGDTDRNPGNILIGEDWKLWMIDFTRAFRRTRTIMKPVDLTRCDRHLLQRLRDVTKEQVVTATKPYIGGAEVDALLARRDLIVALLDKHIAEWGESHVLY